MEDREIVDLYWSRSPQAIAETDRKYGRLCFSVANNVLANREDAQECVNDTFLAAWEAMPPHRPALLGAFLAKITRRIAINRLDLRTAQKRGGGEAAVALEELSECLAQGPGVEELAAGRELTDAVNRFLDGLKDTERKVFLRRYFLLDPVSDIARSFGFSVPKVTSMLSRTRKKLRTYLEKEGYL